MKTFPYVVLVSSYLTACSGGGSPSIGEATFTTDGQFDGGYQVTASLAHMQVASDGGPIQAAQIYLYETPTPPTGCLPADAGAQIPSPQIVVLRIKTHFAGGILPGVFPLFDPTNAIPVDWPLGDAEIDLIDASSPSANNCVASSVSGSVTLTEVGDTWVGTFSGTIKRHPFDSASDPDPRSAEASIAGSFNAPLCPLQ